MLDEANLGQANLQYADLRIPDIDLTIYNVLLIISERFFPDYAKGLIAEMKSRGASLKGADLSSANLRGAKVTKEQLAEARSLEQATMPDGAKYEEWIEKQGS